MQTVTPSCDDKSERLLVTFGEMGMPVSLCTHHCFVQEKRFGLLIMGHIALACKKKRHGTSNTCSSDL